MNVLITNKQEFLLAGLDVEFIKTLRGEYDVEELIGIFSNFFFGKMILDLTAIKDYKNINNIQKLSIALPVEKLIILLPQDDECSSNSYISKLISMGFYNFTTNLDGINYLMDHPNTYKDVAHLHQIETPVTVVNNNSSINNNLSVSNGVVSENTNNNTFNVRIVGVKNVTDGAGATTLIYMMKKELEQFHGMRVKAIEINKRDFMYFHSKDMVSVNKSEFLQEVNKSTNYDLILVDVNDMGESLLTEVLYLIEPSMIKINKIVKRDQKVFEKLKGKRIVLNKSMISNEDITSFASESGLEIFTALRPFNDRSRGQILENFLKRVGLVNDYNEGVDDRNTSGFTSLFKL